MARARLPFRLSGATRAKLAEFACVVGDLVEMVVNDFNGVGCDEEKPNTKKPARTPYRPDGPVDEVTKAKAKQLLRRQGFEDLED